MTDTPTYTITRQFTVPVERLYAAFTDPKILSVWYGPGVETTIHEFDLRVGGVWRNEMNFGKFSDFSRMDFTEIVPNERLRWDHNSTDAKFKTAPNPMMADWPMVFDTVVTFAPVGNGATLTLTQTPKNASAAEIASFAAKMAGMDKGWGSGFDMLAGLLST